MTQEKRVLQHLQIYGEATVRELFTDLYINNPQKAIETLRKKGHRIDTIDVLGEKYSKYIYRGQDEKTM